MSTATLSTDSDAVISYEGPGEFDELIGGTQANFLVRRPGHVAREVAVVLNNNAAAALAAELETENTEAFRTSAASILGVRAIEQTISRFGRIDGLINLGAASLREDPSLVAAAREAVAAMKVAEAMAAARAEHHEEHTHDHDEAHGEGHENAPQAEEQAAAAH